MNAATVRAITLGLLGELVFPLVQAQPARPAGGREQRDEQQENREKELAAERHRPRNVPSESTRS